MSLCPFTDEETEIQRSHTTSPRPYTKWCHTNLWPGLRDAAVQHPALCLSNQFISKRPASVQTKMLPSPQFSAPGASMANLKSLGP